MSMLLTIVTTLVLYWTVCDRGVTVGMVSCQAGHFISQGPANVTCLFQTNIFQTKHNFVVEMYRSRSTLSVAETPLLCSWLVAEKPDCVIKEGYRFEYHITDRLTLNIPNVTQAFAGLYVCRLVPPDGMPAPQCNLTVQDARREDETELSTSPTTIVTDTEPESQRYARREDETELPTSPTTIVTDTEPESQRYARREDETELPTSPTTIVTDTEPESQRYERREDETELPTSPTTIVTDTEPESQRCECPEVNTAVMFVLVEGYVLLLIASVFIHIVIRRLYTTGW